jgi:hypothetical protein
MSREFDFQNFYSIVQAKDKNVNQKAEDAKRRKEKKEKSKSK